MEDRDLKKDWFRAIFSALGGKCREVKHYSGIRSEQLFPQSGERELLCLHMKKKDKR